MSVKVKLLSTSWGSAGAKTLKIPPFEVFLKIALLITVVAMLVLSPVRQGDADSTQDRGHFEKQINDRKQASQAAMLLSGIVKRL